jgi:hypothetical protein
MGRYVAYNPEPDWLLPPSIADELGKDHLAHFIHGMVERLDLGAFEAENSGPSLFCQTGSDPCFASSMRSRGQSDWLCSTHSASSAGFSTEAWQCTECGAISAVGVGAGWHEPSASSRSRLGVKWYSEINQKENSGSHRGKKEG